MVGNIWLQKLEHISYALHFVNRAYQDPGQYDTIHMIFPGKDECTMIQFCYTYCMFYLDIPSIFLNYSKNQIQMYIVHKYCITFELLGCFLCWLLYLRFLSNSPWLNFVSRNCERMTFRAMALQSPSGWYNGPETQRIVVTHPVQLKTPKMVNSLWML